MIEPAPVFSRPAAPEAPAPKASVRLPFDARRKRHQAVTLDDGRAAWIVLERLDRPLEDGDRLASDEDEVVVVRAADEPLLQVRATGAALARCAYHLGNRHALVEVIEGGLRTPADPVMRQMLAQLGADVVEVAAPFRPEIGAYHHEHDHHHGPGKIHRFVMTPRP